MKTDIKMEAQRGASVMALTLIKLDREGHGIELSGKKDGWRNHIVIQNLLKGICQWFSLHSARLVMMIDKDRC